MFAPSRFLADMFRKNGLDHPGFETVPYGLEPGRVKPLPATRPRTPLRLGFCGVLSPWKAPHLLVDAVRCSAANVQLTVHGRIEEPMFQSYIDGVIAAAAGDPRITFAGSYGEQDTPRVFAEMDVLVVPSTWYENTPFVVLEAFAHLGRDDPASRRVGERRPLDGGQPPGQRRDRRLGHARRRRCCGRRKHSSRPCSRGVSRS